MSYVTKIIHVDETDWNAMPAGERSDIIRKFMRDYNNALKGDLNDINLELLRMKIVTLENQKIKIDSELNANRTMLQNAEKTREEDRIKDLEKEKEKIENSKKCAICNFVRADAIKMHNFPIGQVCNTCFMEKRDAKKWFMKN